MGWPHCPQLLSSCGCPGNSLLENLPPGHHAQSEAQGDAAAEASNDQPGAAAKRIRKVVANDNELPEEALSESGSDWEPDWNSEQEDVPMDLAEVWLFGTGSSGFKQKSLRESL